MRLGQITIFIVMGIGLIFILGVVYLMMADIGNQDTDDSYRVVKEFADACLMQVADQAVFEIAWNGGYLQESDFYEDDKPSSSIEWEGRMIPLIDSASGLPKKEDLERRIGKLVLVKFFDCLDLGAFQDQGFTVRGPDVSYEQGYRDHEQVQAKVSMDRDSIRIILTYPIAIIHGTKTVEYETFEHKSSIRLQRAIETLSEQDHGLFRDMEITWMDPMYPYDTAFYLEDYDCDPADPLRFITVRFIDADVYNIIRVIDYINFYVTNHERGLVFQVAQEKDAQRQVRGLICKGTEAST